jgi:hypothetical protein
MKELGRILQKMYFINWIRIPVKLVITFALMKIGWDYSEYLTKWRRKNPQPRWVFILTASANSTCNRQPLLTSLIPTDGTVTTREYKYAN